VYLWHALQGHLAAISMSNCKGSSHSASESKEESRGQILTPEELAFLSVAQLHVWPGTASEVIVPSAPEVPAKAPLIKSDAQQEAKGSAANDRKLQVPTSDLSKLSKENSDLATAVKVTVAKQALIVSSVKDTVPHRGITATTVPQPVSKGVLNFGGRSAYLSKVPRITKPADGSVNQPITIAEAANSHNSNICSVASSSAHHTLKVETKVESELISKVDIKEEPGSVPRKVTAQVQDQNIKSEQGSEKLAPLSPTDRNLSVGKTALPKRSLGELLLGNAIDLVLGD
jgi:hypothetical protein